MSKKRETVNSAKRFGLSGYLSSVEASNLLQSLSTIFLSLYRNLCYCTSRMKYSYLKNTNMALNCRDK